MTRRMPSFLLALLLCCCQAAFAVNNYSLAGDSEGNPGDSVTIVIDGDTDAEIKGYSIVFVFDAAVFDYVSSTLEGTR